MTCFSALGYWRYLLWLTLSLRRCLGRSGWPAQSRGRSSRISPSDYRPTYENFNINPLGYTRTQTYQRSTGGGGSSWNPPRGFGMLEYSETILPSVESLWSSLQDKLYFMSGGAAGGLWRHHQWSPSWISPRFRNQGKTTRKGDFFCLTWKMTHK